MSMDLRGLMELSVEENGRWTDPYQSINILQAAVRSLNGVRIQNPMAWSTTTWQTADPGAAKDDGCPGTELCDGDDPCSLGWLDEVG